MSRFVRDAFARHLGHAPEAFERPVIGICNTYSEVNRCHAHPATMLYRNLAAMDTEEMIRAQPLDGVVLLSACDKTVPTQIMGAISADKPAILLTGGPMINGEHEGRTLGACTDCRWLWQEHRAGNVSTEELDAINASLAPSAGHCMVMGTASTMAVCAEAMGLILPGTAAIPAPYDARLHAAQLTGQAIVALVQKDFRPKQIVTRAALENAIRVLMAVGGSTNAVIHLLAIARRSGIALTLEQFDAIGRSTPLIANLRPAGKYQMQAFYHAGSTPAVMAALGHLLDLDCLTVTGRSVGENLAGAGVPPAYSDVIRPPSDPLPPEGGIAVLKGNRAPRGAVIKPKAATHELVRHRGRAVVFDSIEDLQQRVNDPGLAIEPGDVMVLRNAGPVGAPGMPEAGMLPIPKKLLERGVRDMVRLSDARMSGTAFGTVVLHIAPEAAIGGPLALVRDGDQILLDVPNRRLELLLPDEELEARRALWRPPQPHFHRGYVWLFCRHVPQADEGGLQLRLSPARGTFGKEIAG